MTYDACECDWENQASVCHVKNVKARKQYCCEECRSTITVGEQYENTWGVWEGEGSTFRTCALCAELKRWARISVPCFCWTYGDLHENIRDMVREVRPDVPKGFVFEWGRRMLKIERRRSGQHWPRQYRRRQPPRSAFQIATEARP